MMSDAQFLESSSVRDCKMAKSNTMEPESKVNTDSTSNFDKSSDIDDLLCLSASQTELVLKQISDYENKESNTKSKMVQNVL